MSRIESWGELNEAHPFQPQQKFSAGHVFEVSVGLVPVPVMTQLSGDEFSAPLPMVLDEGLDEGKVIGGNLTSPEDKNSFPGLGYNKFLSGTLLKNGRRSFWGKRG
jgi:hypothetical protein